MRVRLLLSAPLLVLVVQASAQTTSPATQTFNVTIDVNKTCVIDAVSDIAFGSVAVAASNPTASGSIAVRCSTGTAYTLGLDDGLHSGGGTRNMMHSTLSDLIPYTLSSDSGHTAPWGNESSTWATGTGLGTTQSISHPVYARATLTGDEPPGTYQDMVTATLTF